MSCDVVIDVRGIRKSFKVHASNASRIVNALSFGALSRPHSFFALDDVSFQVRRGETIGLLGANGGGKSTILQMIAGTMTPTEGRITVEGRVAALLELGTGFSPDFTGRENALLSMKLLAPDERDVAERMAWIEDFAGIGDFIDRPVRTYSSGMFVRLAFAVASSVRPDVLIVDEALAVGDAAFQQKCFSLIRNGKAASARLVVSHDMAAIAAICDRVCVLSRGRLVYDGPVAGGIREHLSLCNGGADPAASPRSGPRDIDVGTVALSVGGRRSTVVRHGDEVEIDVSLTSSRSHPVRALVGIDWKDRLGQSMMTDWTLSVDDFELVLKPGESTVRLRHAWGPLMSGDYNLTIQVAELPYGQGGHQIQQCLAHDLAQVSCLAPFQQRGVLPLALSAELVA